MTAKSVSGKRPAATASRPGGAPVAMIVRGDDAIGEIIDAQLPDVTIVQMGGRHIQCLIEVAIVKSSSGIYADLVTAHQIVDGMGVVGVDER